MEGVWAWEMGEVFPGPGERERLGEKQISWRLETTEKAFRDYMSCLSITSCCVTTPPLSSHTINIGHNTLELVKREGLRNQGKGTLSHSDRQGIQ